MGDKNCNRDTCFYCAAGQCFNLAVNQVDNCELYLNYEMRKQMKPGGMKKPAMPRPSPAKAGSA